MVGADATVYVGFRCQIYVYLQYIFLQTKAGYLYTVASASARFYVDIQSIFEESVAESQRNAERSNFCIDLNVFLIHQYPSLQVGLEGFFPTKFHSSFPMRGKNGV